VETKVNNKMREEGIFFNFSKEQFICRAYMQEVTIIMRLQAGKMLK